MNYIPSLPLGLSQRDLEPRDIEAEYQRELDKADTQEQRIAPALEADANRAYANLTASMPNSPHHDTEIIPYFE